MTPGSLFIGGPNWELAHVSVEITVNHKAQLLDEWLKDEIESFRRSVGQRFRWLRHDLQRRPNHD